MKPSIIYLSKRLSLFFFCLYIPAAFADALALPSTISAQWLKQNLNHPNLKIIEFSSPTSFSFDGHIPGAIHSHKSEWRFQSEDGALTHHPFDILQKHIQALGINNTDAVVIYYKGDELNDLLGAHYLFWLFHLLGHTQVAMLDQGWHAWKNIGGEIELKDSTLEKGNFIAHPIPSLSVSTDELYAIYRHYTLIDGRPHSHYLGTEKFAANSRFGHIAGSLNQPWKTYLKTDQDGLIYIDNQAIPALLKTGLIAQKQPILLTCFGGTGAAINYTLFYIHGYKNLRLHDAGLRRWNTRLFPLTISNNRFVTD